MGMTDVRISLNRTLPDLLWRRVGGAAQSNTLVAKTPV